jgi:hypothetical protein
MSQNHKIIQDSLPKDGVPATGQFKPAVNIALNTFEDEGLATDSPYNTTYIGDLESKLVGSADVPYLPMALPAYIPTLYENIFHIQTNLKDEIGENVVNAREYPTTNAVKAYVQTQLAGREFLIPNSGTDKVNISTFLTTSFLTASNVVGANVNLATKDGVNVYTTTYNINAMTDSRDGAEKLCINTSPIGAGVDNDNLTDIYNLQIVLDKENQFFVALGRKYKCYVPACLGDALGMVQFMKDGEELFFVLSYGGAFKVEAVPPYYSN